jgi:hypothetical protein
MPELNSAAADASVTGAEKILTLDFQYILASAIANLFNGSKGADIASATTTDIGAATGIYVHVTGTTTITGLGTVAAGTLRVVRFAGALTLTHNATSLILPTGANITTAANDVAMFESEGSGNWRCISYTRANGAALYTPPGTVSALTPASGVVNINCALGDYFTLAPTANITSITFSNLPASGKAQTIMVRFTQDTTARTVAWPASFKWAGGSSGAVSTGSGEIDIIALTTFNQGTTWLATIAKAFA